MYVYIYIYIYGIIQGTIIGVMQGDTRSLDDNSYVFQGLRTRA